jgi:hypothetical protein
MLFFFALSSTFAYLPNFLYRIQENKFSFLGFSFKDIKMFFEQVTHCGHYECLILV